MYYPKGLILQLFDKSQKEEAFYFVGKDGMYYLGHNFSYWSVIENQKYANIFNVYTDIFQEEI